MVMSTVCCFGVIINIYIDRFAESRFAQLCYGPLICDKNVVDTGAWAPFQPSPTGAGAPCLPAVDPAPPPVAVRPVA